MTSAEVRTVVLRVVALALLLLLTLIATIAIRTMRRLPDATIYLIADRTTTFTLEPVHRRVDARDPEALAHATVAALARGPSAEEAQQGLSSAVPPETEVRSAELRDGRLSVDLSDAFASGGGSASMVGRLEQVRWTLTQPTAVDELTLRLGGDPLEVLGGEGILVSQPWRRPDGDRLPSW